MVTAQFAIGMSSAMLVLGHVLGYILRTAEGWEPKPEGFRHEAHRENDEHFAEMWDEMAEDAR